MSRRCIVPASGFYEWKPEGAHKVPYYIRLSDGAPMGFAGIWESWKTPNGLGLETFAILTTSANPLISTIHDRRPVILHPDAYSLWLDKDVKSPEQVNNRYGDFIVTFASLMDTEEKGSHVISPTWRPNGIRCVDMK